MRHGLVPVICVGETAEDLEKHGAERGAGRAAARGARGRRRLEADIVVAYEPVWAIGSGQAATPEQAQEVCATLREVIAEKLGDGCRSAARASSTAAR